MLTYSDGKERKSGFKLAVFATAVAVCVVMLGAFTRLVDAGLGCPDWPVCYGHILWPMEAEDVSAANARFPDTPVDHDKTWPEQVHRIFASSLGLFCIALVVVALVQRFKRKDYAYPIKLPIFLLVLVIVQGLFGMWTVTLKLWPQVVTAHLLGGFLTLSLLCLLSMRLHNSHWHLIQQYSPQVDAVKPFALAGLCVVILQIALGGWTTSNYAALACPDFPQCQTSWWPPMDFSQGFNFFQQIGPNYLGGLMDSAARTAIHFSHRIGAIAVAITVLILSIRLLKLDFIQARRWGMLLLSVLFLQLGLGVSNVLFALPLTVAVLHNAVGALLLIMLVLLCNRLFSLQISAEPD